MSKRKFFILLTAIAFTPVMWWFFVKAAPELSRIKYSLNVYHPLQKIYWYVFFSTHHIKDTIFAYIVHKLNKWQYLKIYTKYLYFYQMFLFVEYLLLGGRFPILPFSGILVLIGLDIYKRNNNLN